MKETRAAEQLEMEDAARIAEEGAAEVYEAFTEKFKPKKTTDDCYTPRLVYDALAAWVAEKYHLDKARFLRPFWPGGDYEKEDYPEGCIVVDNPPFSILGKIIRYYCDRGICFYLFAPSLTCLTFARHRDLFERCTAVITDTDVTYENGATVKTAFITNLEPGVILKTEPELRKVLKSADEIQRKQGKAELPRYVYPMEVISAATAQRLARAELVIRAEDAVFTQKLDAQKHTGKEIFGGGLILSERAAAERAAAERAAAERAAAIEWQLSEREKNLFKQRQVTILELMEEGEP